MLSRLRWLLVSFLLVAQAVSAVELRLLDAENRPISDAQVVAYAPPKSDGLLARMIPALASGRTGPDGKLPISLPEIDSLVLAIDHADFLPFLGTVSPRDLATPVRLSRGKPWELRVSPVEAEAGNVCARWLARPAEWAPLQRFTRCASVSRGGQVRLAGLPSVEVELTVQARGFLPLVRSAKAEDHLILRLERGTLLRGSVREPTGVPITDAEVRSPGLVFPVKTTDSGSFEVVVAKLPVELEVRAEGFRLLRSTIHEDVPIMIELSPVERLSGLALDDRGQPLESIEIWVDRAIEAGSHRSWQNKVATVEGRFTIDLDGPGQYRVRMRSPGFRSAARGGVAVATGETFDLGVVTLGRGAGFRGRVRNDQTGNGLSGVDVTALPVGTALLDALRLRDLPRTTSDEQGNFLLTGLPAGGYELRFSRAGYADAAEQRTLERGEVEALGEILLGRGVAVRGRVAGRQHDPRPGVLVRLSSAAGDSLLPLVELTTGEGGQFGPVSLSPGSYRAEVFRGRTLLVQEVTVPATAASEVEWELVVQAVHLQGQILRGGQPVTAGTVSLASALDPTDQRGKVLLTAPDFGAGAAGWGLPDGSQVAPLDSEGRFELNDIPAGLAYLAITNAAVSTTRAVEIPDIARAELLLELDGRVLEGRLVDRETRQGIVEGLVLLGDLAGHEFGQVATDSEGRFLFDLVASGRYRLFGAAQSFASGSLEVEVGDESPLPVELALDQENVAELILHFGYATGENAAGTPLTLLDDSGRLARSLPTDSEGERIFSDLPPGRYSIAWTDGLAGTGGFGPLEVRTGDPLRIERRLDSGQLVTIVGEPEAWGDAIVSDFRLLAAGIVPLTAQLPALGVGARFSVDGRLSLGKLSPGSYRLEIRAARDLRRLDFAVGTEPVQLLLP